MASSPQAHPRFGNKIRIMSCTIPRSFLYGSSELLLPWATLDYGSSGAGRGYRQRGLIAFVSDAGMCPPPFLNVWVTRHDYIHTLHPRGGNPTKRRNLWLLNSGVTPRIHPRVVPLVDLKHGGRLWLIIVQTMSKRKKGDLNDIEKKSIVVMMLENFYESLIETAV